MYIYQLTINLYLWAMYSAEARLSISPEKVRSCIMVVQVCCTRHLQRKWMRSCLDVEIRSGGRDQWVTARSQDLKAHEKGSANPCKLRHHWSWCAAERPVDEQTAEGEGDGKVEGERSSMGNRMVEMWGGTASIEWSEKMMHEAWRTEK